MDWVKWIIPLIALAVWILSNLAKPKDEPRRLPRQQPPNDDANRPRRTPSDIEKFLEEARRRRRAEEESAKERERRSTPPPISTQQAEKPRPRPQPTVPKPAAPSSPPRYPDPARRVPAEMESRPSVDELPLAVAVPTSDPTRTPSPPEAAQVSAAADSRDASPVSMAPAVRQVLGMLKTPQSLATAMLLKEILDPPLCRRPRRFPR